MDDILNLVESVSEGFPFLLLFVSGFADLDKSEPKTILTMPLNTRNPNAYSRLSSSLLK